MTTTKVGVNTPDSGIQLSVEGIDTRGGIEAAGVALGEADPDGVASKAGSDVPAAAATTKVRFTFCSIPLLSE